MYTCEGFDLGGLVGFARGGAGEFDARLMYFGSRSSVGARMVSAMARIRFMHAWRARSGSRCGGFYGGWCR